MKNIEICDNSCVGCNRQGKLCRQFEILTEEIVKRVNEYEEMMNYVDELKSINNILEIENKNLELQNRVLITLLERSAAILSWFDSNYDAKRLCEFIKDELERQRLKDKKTESEE